MVTASRAGGRASGSSHGKIFFPPFAIFCYFAGSLNRPRINLTRVSHPPHGNAPVFANGGRAREFRSCAVENGGKFLALGKTVSPL